MKMTAKHIFSAFAIFTALAATHVSAQQIPGRSGMVQPATAASTPTAAPKAEWVVTPKEEIVRIPLHKVVALRLPEAQRNVHVVIANPDIADVRPTVGDSTQILILAQQVGSTSIVFQDDQGKILFQGDIQVDVDVAGIQTAIREMLPEEKIDVVAHRNSVFLKGFVRSNVASNAAVNITRKFVGDPVEVINNLEVLGSQQVIMQVRVAEIKRSALKRLGVNVSIDGSGGFNGITMTTAGQTAFDTSAFNNFVSSTVTTSLGGLGPITVTALEREGLAKTLAEPTLTALTGENASFLVGGSFPMPVAYDASTGTTTYEQTRFGVGLNFTPVVLDKGRISLRVQTTVSDRDPSVAITLGAATIPGLTEKTTTTTVELPSGGTLFIAGLLQNDMSNYVEGVPGLKDIPILGALFRSQSFQNEETELVISMTAYLAAPTGNSEPLALPSDGFAPSGDLDFYLLGRLHKLYAHSKLPPYATPLTGPYGYIME